MRLQVTDGFGGAELSWRTRGDSFAQPHVLEFPALSEIVAVQKAIDTSWLVSEHQYEVADMPLPPVSVPVTKMLFWSFVQGIEPSSYCPFHCVNVVEGGDLMLQVSHEGGVESMRPVGELHVLMFPALSLMVTWQFAPSVVTVQEPPAVRIPLWPSVELERVKFTDVFPQPVVAGFQLPQEGSTSSIFAMGELQVVVLPAWSRMVTWQLSPL